MCFLNINVFYFLFIFIATTPCTHRMPAIPHPPRLQLRVGVGVSLCTPQTANPPSLLANVSWRWVSSQSPPPHLPRSQTQAEGGFKITTTPPPRLQMPAEGGFTQHHQHHPTFLTCKRKLGVGFPSPTSNSTTPTLLARKCEPGVGINNTDNGAHKCEPGVGVSLSTFQPPQPHPPHS